MLVRDIMKRHVITIDPEARVIDAAQLMRKHSIGSLIVIKNNEAKGIITKWDILTKVVAEGKDPAEIKVRDVMSSPLLTIDHEASVEEAAMLMVKNKIKKLGVTKDNRLIGIITAYDIVATEPLFMKQIAELFAYSINAKIGC